jgi:hypothetical protein
MIAVWMGRPDKVSHEIARALAKRSGKRPATIQRWRHTLNAMDAAQQIIAKGITHRF